MACTGIGWEGWQEASQHCAFNSGVTADPSNVILPVQTTSSVGEVGSWPRVGAFPTRRGKRSPGGGGTSPAATINRAANGAPLAGGRFVRATAVYGAQRPGYSARAVDATLVSEWISSLQ
jgi:hypothetical protein